MRDKSKTQDLLKSFRESRSQMQTPVEKSSDSTEKYYKISRSKPRSRSSDSYDAFLARYCNIEAEIDNFNAVDLVYFFREKAQEAGFKYVIANFARDGAVMKKVLTNYSAREICLMIEFLYNSEQDYLDKASLRPTVLSSAWCNTIYPDSLLWVDDKYVPRSKKSSSHVEKREWNKAVSSETAKIGEWDDD